MNKVKSFLRFFQFRFFQFRAYFDLAFVLALAITVLNAFKPATMDDPVYLAMANQILHTPLQPYGPPPGTMLIWYQKAQPSFTILAPPVLPYWLAANQFLWGDNLFLLKMSLLPILWLFTASLSYLYRYFAPTIAKPLLILTVLSPAFLPGINLMLDIPALAFSLTSITLFLRSINPSSLAISVVLNLSLKNLPIDRTSVENPTLARKRSKPSYLLLIASAIFAALALQTKYSVLALPLVILTMGFCFRKLRQALALVILIGILFGSWELYIYFQYNYSHFLYHSFSIFRFSTSSSSSSLIASNIPVYGHAEPKIQMILPLVSHFGGVAPFLGWLWICFAYSHLSSWLRKSIFGLLWILCCLALFLLLLPENRQVISASGKQSSILTISHLFFAISGFWNWLAFLILCRICYQGSNFKIRIKNLDQISPPRLSPLGFLLLWLAIESGTMILISPFPATRRVYGFMIVFTLTGGHVAQIVSQFPGTKRSFKWVYRIVCFNTLLGLTASYIDTQDAEAPQILCQKAIVRIHEDEKNRDTDTNHRIWFLGHWGLAYAAPKNGMVPLFPEISIVNPGDYLVLPDPDTLIAAPSIKIPRDRCDYIDDVIYEIPSIFRSIPEYYGGKIPWIRKDTKSWKLRIFRFYAETKISLLPLS